MVDEGFVLSDILDQLKNLYTGKKTPQEIVEFLHQPLKSREPLDETTQEELKNLTQSLTNLKITPPQEDISKYFTENIEKAKEFSQTQTVDPLFLMDLTLRKDLSSFGVPVSEVTPVDPLAMTKYQQRLTEIENLLQRSVAPTQDVISNPPQYQPPSFLPVLGLLAALGGMAGGYAGAMPFLALGAALKGGAEKAYASQLKASNLVLGGVEELRQVAKDLKELATRKYDVEKEKVIFLKEVANQLTENDVKKALSHFLEKIKTSSDIIEALTDLPPEERLVLLGSNIGQNLVNQAANLARTKVEEDLRLKRNVYLEYLQHSLRMKEIQERAKLSEKEALAKPILKEQAEKLFYLENPSRFSSAFHSLAKEERNSILSKIPKENETLLSVLLELRPELARSPIFSKLEDQDKTLAAVLGGVKSIADNTVNSEVGNYFRDLLKMELQIASLPSDKLKELYQKASKEKLSSEQLERLVKNRQNGIKEILSLWEVPVLDNIKTFLYQVTAKDPQALKVFANPSIRTTLEEIMVHEYVKLGIPEEYARERAKEVVELLLNNFKVATVEPLSVPAKQEKKGIEELGKALERFIGH